MAKQGEITSAKITTFTTARKYDYDFESKAAEYAESYGWIFHKPSSKSTVIEYHFIDNEEDSPEFGTVLFGGETSSLYFVAAKCTCGCQFATEYMMDECSALSNVTCPDCKAETQEVDDSVEWKRISKNFAK